MSFPHPPSEKLCTAKICQFYSFKVHFLQFPLDFTNYGTILPAEGGSQFFVVVARYITGKCYPQLWNDCLGLGEEGVRVCSAEEVPEGGMHEVELLGAKILLVR